MLMLSVLWCDLCSTRYSQQHGTEDDGDDEYEDDDDVETDDNVDDDNDSVADMKSSLDVDGQDSPVFIRFPV